MLKKKKQKNVIEWPWMKWNLTVIFKVKMIAWQEIHSFTNQFTKNILLIWLIKGYYHEGDKYSLHSWKCMHAARDMRDIWGTFPGHEGCRRLPWYLPLRLLGAQIPLPLRISHSLPNYPRKVARYLLSSLLLRWPACTAREYDLPYYCCLEFENALES